MWYSWPGSIVAWQPVNKKVLFLSCVDTDQSGSIMLKMIHMGELLCILGKLICILGESVTTELAFWVNRFASWVSWFAFRVNWLASWVNRLAYWVNMFASWVKRSFWAADDPKSFKKVQPIRTSQTILPVKSLATYTWCQWWNLNKTFKITNTMLE